uniref:PDZ domain-containing protein n=1 Tax=Parascaris univalens TaxID=6257 RepID=A0A915AW72_PARUN
VESDEIDYSAAASYYSNQPFFTHRPGPVYTIPEGEEQDDGHIDTDSKFYAKEMARRAQTTKIPTVPVTPVLQPKTTTTSIIKGATSGVYAQKEVSSRRDVTTTVYSGDYYDQQQKRQGEIMGVDYIAADVSTKSSTTPSTTLSTTSAIVSRTTAATASTPSSPLTPVRSAPPPPDTCTVDVANSEISSYVFCLSGITTKPNSLDTTKTTDITTLKGTSVQKTTADEEIASHPSPYDNVANILPLSATQAQHAGINGSTTISSFIYTTTSANVVVTNVITPSTSSVTDSTAHLTETLGSRLDSSVGGFSQFPIEDSSATSRLKRSPAMMLANGARSQSTTDATNHFSFSNHISIFTPTTSTVKEDDVLSVASSEMGRRKLPSIPTQRAEKASDAPPAPIYLTSSAPLLPSTSQQQSHFSQDTRAYSRPSSRTASLTDLSRPSSSASSVISSQGYRTVDPAIIPGAAIASDVRPKPPLRQTTTAATGGRPPPVLTQASSKMPSTLARVLLKKELKEVLERRRESLEACEIEANHRQYVVHRMLITGLLPEYRPADIDDIPNVIPCLLPVELISGARVIRNGGSTAAESSKTTVTTAATTAAGEQHFAQAASVVAQTQEVGVSTDEFPPEPRSKSVGTQAELSHISSRVCSPPSSSSYHMPSTSLRMQIEHERSSSSQPRVRSAETQTNGLSAHDQRRSKATTPSTYSRRQKASNNGNHASSSDPNLLESTAKYFAEYDRQLREHGRRLKNRFAFTDDDPVSRESKKLRLMDELAQRKEKISSMTDLSSSANFPTIYPSSDYASTVPHYGSLPTIDYPITRNGRSPPSRLRDFTYRDPMRVEPFGYGSLPRNYERYMDIYGYDAGQDDFVQPPHVSTRRYDALSRSLHDLNLSSDDNIIDPRMRPFTTRSTGYLDRYGDVSSRFDHFQPSRRKPIYGSLHGPDVRSMQRRFDGPQSLPNSDMISQYANYLSNQFMTGQQQLMNEYPNQPTSLSDDAYKVSLPTYSTGRYDAPLSDSRLQTMQDSLVQPSTEPYSTYETQPSNYGMSVNQRATYQPSGFETQSALPSSYSYADQPYIADNFANVPSYQYSGQPGSAGTFQPDYRYPTLPLTSCLPPSAVFGYQPSTISAPLSQVYSRNDDNYGSRPTHFATEYGNFHRNRVAAGSAQTLNDLTNRNYIRSQQYPDIYSASTAGLSVGRYGTRLPQSRHNISDPLAINQLPSSATDPYRTYDNGLTQQRYGRAWPNGNPLTSSYDAVYPKEDALTRMYATAAYPRSSRFQQTGNTAEFISQSGALNRFL